MVSATFGFVRSAATLADFGTVPIRTRSPSVQKPIGMTRGSPSRPTYAIRAGSGPLSSCCAYGLARMLMISSVVMLGASSRRCVHIGGRSCQQFLDTDIEGSHLRLQVRPPEARFADQAVIAAT